MMILPAIATAVALTCAAVIGRDAWRRPRAERIVWTIAFLLFAVGAGAEVVGALAGWTPLLARTYYLSGAVLVVGLLALGELYLLFPHRMPAITPGLTLLVVAVAVTAVWSAPINSDLLQFRGWDAIERGPFLVALTATINAVGTVVLVGGAAYSAWRMRGTSALRQRAYGCVLIAAGAVAVATGGTLTRFGQREYLYLAMAVGISIIFAGVMLTRRPSGQALAPAAAGDAAVLANAVPLGQLTPFPVRTFAPSLDASLDAGIQYIVDRLLPLADADVAETCQRWSAQAHSERTISREQAKQVWALRLLLPAEQYGRFDALPLTTQAQIAELYWDVWCETERQAAGVRHA